MHSKQKGKRFKLLIRAFAAGVACMFGILLGIYLARVEIANHLTIQALAQKGFPNSQVQISRLDPTLCILDKARLQSDSFTLQIEGAEIRYELDKLWKEKKISSIHIGALKLSYRIIETSDDPSTFDPQALDEQIKSGLPFPLESLKIENASIELLSALGLPTWDATLELFLEDKSKIRTRLAAQSETGDLELDATISDTIDFSAKVSSGNLHETLTSYGIDLESLFQIPEEASLALSSATVHAQGSFHGTAFQGADITASLGPVRYAANELEVAARSLQAKLRLDPEWQVHDLKAVLGLEKATYASFQADESIIEIETPDLTEFAIELPETQWESESGESGMLAASIKAQLDSDYAVSGFEAQGSASELASNAFSMRPFEFSIEGDLDVLRVSTTSLTTQEHPWIRLEDFQAAITELTTNKPLISLSAILNAGPVGDSPPPISGSWELSGTLRPLDLPQAIALSLKPASPGKLLAIPGLNLEGDGALQLSLRHWPEEGQAALKLAFNADSLSGAGDNWTLDGGAVDASLATTPLSLSKLQASIDRPAKLLEQIAQASQYAISFQGNQVAGPYESSAQWFSGTLQSDDSKKTSTSPLQAKLELSIGIARAASEEAQQITLQTQLGGDARQLSLDSQMELLFEGEPVSIATTQSLDLSAEMMNASMEYSIKGIKLINSNILSRHEPTLSGTTVSARIGIGGTARINENGWDATTTLQLADGAFAYPYEDIAIDAIQATIAFDSVAELRSAPSQTLTAGQLTLGDLQATDLAIQFSLDGKEQLAIEKAQLATFDGTLALDPFELSLEDPVADLVLRFEDLSIAPAIAMLDFFDGHVSGRLNGALPIHLIDGRTTLGEGYLELSPNNEATFSYNAKGFFTGEGDPYAPPKAMSDKLLERLGLEPNALLEDALGKLDIHDLRIDLFNKDLPDTPMRIQLAGIADTGAIEIPLNITTNINGTVAELFDFLKRLDSLGLVLDQ